MHGRGWGRGVGGSGGHAIGAGLTHQTHVGSFLLHLPSICAVPRYALAHAAPWNPEAMCSHAMCVCLSCAAADCGKSRAIVDVFAALMDLSADRSRLDAYLLRGGAAGKAGGRRGAVDTGGAAGGRVAGSASAAEGEGGVGRGGASEDAVGDDEDDDDSVEWSEVEDAWGACFEAAGAKASAQQAGLGQRAARGGRGGGARAGAGGHTAELKGAEVEVEEVEVDVEGIDAGEQERILAAILRDNGARLGGRKRAAEGPSPPLKQATLKRFFQRR